MAMSIFLFLVAALLAVFLWLGYRAEMVHSRRPQVFDGDPAHIRALEHELGLCEDAVFVEGEPWLVCAALHGRPPMMVDPDLLAVDARPRRRKRGRLTNNFGPRNERAWKAQRQIPPPPEPMARPDTFEK